MSRAPVDVLDVINRVAIFNGGLVADDLCKVGEAVEELIAAAREVEPLLPDDATRISPKAALAGVRFRRALAGVQS